MATDCASTAEQEGPSQPSPESVITKGKTFLVVHDYFNAVGTLAEGCRLLSEKYGETGDELAESYLLYGRALLGLAREEQAVLGTGVPGVQEEDEEEFEDDDSHEDDDAAGATESAPMDKEPSSEKEDTVKENADKVSNGEASTSVTSVTQNGQVHKNGDVQEEEGVQGMGNEDDDESSNLQIAWEVLELAKMIVQKRDDSVEKSQFLAETHRLLGEVALESGNQAGAIADLSTCLEIMAELENVTSRHIAEVYYQMGLAYSLGNGYSASIEYFEKALDHLGKRIDYLKGLKKPQQQDVDSKCELEEEIKEIRELIPEIKEKIDDMKDMKEQTCKVLLQSIKEQIGGSSSSNGAGPSGASTSSAAEASASTSSASSTSVSIDAKPASDINHLIRKKRKNEDDNTEAQGSPCKKSHDALSSNPV